MLTAFIGKGVEFKGNINYNGTIRIDGKMEGEVSTEGCFLIGAEAVVTAKVTAGTIICKGTIIGEVVAKEKVRCVLQPSLREPSPPRCFPWKRAFVLMEPSTWAHRRQGKLQTMTQRHLPYRWPKFCILSNKYSID